MRPAPCLVFVPPPCFSVVTSVFLWLLLVMGRLTVVMELMRLLVWIRVGLGFAMEEFSQGHSHVFRIPGMKKKSIWGEKIEFNLKVTLSFSIWKKIHLNKCSSTLKFHFDDWMMVD